MFYMLLSSLKYIRISHYMDHLAGRVLPDYVRYPEREESYIIQETLLYSSED